MISTVFPGLQCVNSEEMLRLSRQVGGTISRINCSVAAKAKANRLCSGSGPDLEQTEDPRGEGFTYSEGVNSLASGASR